MVSRKIIRHLDHLSACHVFALKEMQGHTSGLRDFREGQAAGYLSAATTLACEFGLASPVYFPRFSMKKEAA